MGKTTRLKGFAFLIMFIFIIAGCAPNSFPEPINNTYVKLEQFLENQYKFIDVVKSSSNQNDSSKAYLAENKSISIVLEEISKEVPPQEISELVNQKQALVYPEHFVILTTDDMNPEHTVVELASNGFVRENYSPDFFDGMFVMWFLDEVLDVDDWGKKQKKRCLDATGNCYQGYGVSGGSYKGPTSKPPTLRSPPRGGGPGTGK